MKKNKLIFSTGSKIDSGKEERQAAPVKPEKDIPTKPNPNPDPTKPKPGGNEPRKNDPTRIEQPQKTDPTRIDEPTPQKKQASAKKSLGK